MDFDAGNLIYILATVVALLAGVFNKKKKTVRKAPVKGEPAKLTFFEKLEDQLSGLIDQSGMTSNSGEVQVEGEDPYGESGNIQI